MQQLERQSTRPPLRAPRVHAPARLHLVGLALRERRRGANEDKFARGRELVCECAASGCQARLPSSSGRHRGKGGVGERFLVTPSHIGNDAVVGAADRFFIVEFRRELGSQ
jgi:hypothetical protein